MSIYVDEDIGVPAESLTEAVTMKKELHGISQNSFGWAKRLMTDSFDTPFETQIEWYGWGLKPAGSTRTASRAFSEKRKPVFNNFNR
jgi:hypothetical protein